MTPAPHFSPPRLPAFALFAACLAAAGLPIYIRAPKFHVDEYGVSLGLLGTVLSGLRMIDVVQDPFLAWIAAHMRAWRGATVLGAGALMAGLFVMPPPVRPIWWFALMLAAVFSCFIYLTICFYAQGVASAAMGAGHLRLARRRETGALLGICVASVASMGLGEFTGFALGFAALGVTASWAMRAEWRGAAICGEGFAPVLRDGASRRLLLIALVNAAPVAVSSTLFLFFVESRLAAPGWEGPLLLIFFLSAALAAPLWSRETERWGARRVLLGAMVMAIAAFGWAALLGAGDARNFAVVCALSGAAVGADMTLLPAIFARRGRGVRALVLHVQTDTGADRRAAAARTGSGRVRSRRGQ